MTTALDIVACAARTPLGLSAADTAAAVRAGIAGFGEFPFVTRSGEPMVVCADDEIPSSLDGPARLQPMIDTVLGEIRTALEPVRYTGPCYLLIALPETRPGFSDADAKAVATHADAGLRPHQPDLRVGVVGRGHAGSLRAIERAAQESAKGVHGLFVVLAVDSYHHPDTFIWLERDKRFAQPGVRAGFTPGEGAGCLVLVSPALRHQLDMPVLATVAGIGTAQETLLRDSDTGSFGRGMIAALDLATAALQLPAEAADIVYADINGERYRSEEWGFAAMEKYAAMKSLEYELPASSWGDVGAAFGPLAASLFIQSHARRYAKGPRALVMAGSDSGLRGAMVLQRANGR
jgi:3-oxoacyl-[acyl-carrier-protein] synthase-1